MKIKSKKNLCKVLILVLIVVAISIINRNFSTFHSNNTIKNDSELAYIDFNSDEFQQNFSRVLEKEYGKNYKQIIAKNTESTLIASKINEMFVSNKTNELKYPDYIGGLYINDNNDLIVQLKQNEIPSTNQLSYSKYNSMLSIDDNILTEYVNHSYNELEYVYELLNNSIGKSNVFSNISAYYIDVINNCVVVELLNNSIEEQNKFKGKLIDSDIIKFKQGASPILEAYNTGQGVHKCTLGFRAKLGNTTGFVTAGHCVSHLSIDKDYSTYGTLKAYKQGDKVDAAFIQTSTPINTTLQYSVYPVTSVSTSAYVTNLAVGTMVGKSGKTTYGTSGRIKSLNATWNAIGTGDDAITITNMIQADYNSDKGDSGAPVFTISGGVVIGVHRGAINGIRYSSSYNNIKSALGISIY